MKIVCQFGVFLDSTRRVNRSRDRFVCVSVYSLLLLVCFCIGTVLAACNIAQWWPIFITIQQRLIDKQILSKFNRIDSVVK
jgi:hypothetical protein